MIKATIFNMEDFLHLVNGCSGAVNILDSNGGRENINKRHDIQGELRKQHKENGHCLRLSLDIPNPQDYMKIVFFYVGDC